MTGMVTEVNYMSERAISRFLFLSFWRNHFPKYPVNGIFVEIICILLRLVRKIHIKLISYPGGMLNLTMSLLLL